MIEFKFARYDNVYRVFLHHINMHLCFSQPWWCILFNVTGDMCQNPAVYLVPKQCIRLNHCIGSAAMQQLHLC